MAQNCLLKNVRLARKALKDNSENKLSDGATIVVFNLLFGKRRKPTKNEIEYGRTLEPQAAKFMKSK